MKIQLLTVLTFYCFLNLFNPYLHNHKHCRGEACETADSVYDVSIAAGSHDEKGGECTACYRDKIFKNIQGLFKSGYEFNICLGDVQLCGDFLICKFCVDQYLSRAPPDTIL